jgi:hypothetical protein
MNSLIQRIATAAMGLAVAATAHAQPRYDNAEDASRIGEEHAARLQRDTVARFGDVRRFEIRVSWKEPSQRPEAEAPLRVVRYLARCESREMALAAVAVFDTSGRMVKSLGVPPGAWDYVKAEEGSAEAEALDSACRMPL